MTVRPIPSFLLAAAMFSVTPARAANNDLVPPAAPAGGWAAQSPTFDYILDGGKVQRYRTMGILVDNMLIATHVQTSKGTALKHWHMEADFPVAGAPSVRDKADAYWDWFFDAPAKTSRKANASNANNCHSVALDSLGKGVYKYWIDTPADNTGYGDDAKAVVKANAANGDLLWYDSQDHSSILKTVNPPASGVPASYLIRWKNNSSGIYEYTNSDLGTPGQTAGNPAVGAPPPAGGWASDGIGKEANLTPAGNVQRKN